MSTTLAISTSQSSAAMAMAHSAKVKACEGIVMNFDAKGAAVEAMQVYADCVDLLHPQYTDGTLSMLRYALIACFIGSAFGAKYGWDEDGPVMAVLGFIVGFAGTAAALFVLWLLLMTGAFVVGM